MPQAEYVWPREVDIVEVGLRDGLQREQALLSVDEKLALIDGLVAAGIRRLQVTAFVHPKRVPQMADADALCARLAPHPGVTYSGLALNLKGVERARDAGLSHVDISVSASEPHSRRNANRGVAEALAEWRDMAAAARQAGLTIRAGIQCAFGYQQPDDVHADDVLRLAEQQLTQDVAELALADSAGLADPRRVGALLDRVLPLTGSVPVVLHLHDTRGMGLANVLAGLEHGARAFDTAFGGLGGCPFIDGAAGNIATEDTVFMLRQMGIETGIDPERVAALSASLAPRLGKQSLPGKMVGLLVG